MNQKQRERYGELSTRFYFKSLDDSELREYHQLKHMDERQDYDDSTIYDTPFEYDTTAVPSQFTLPITEVQYDLPDAREEAEAAMAVVLSYCGLEDDWKIAELSRSFVSTIESLIKP